MQYVEAGIAWELLYSCRAVHERTTDELVCSKFASFSQCSQLFLSNSPYLPPLLASIPILFLIIFPQVKLLNPSPLFLQMGFKGWSHLFYAFRMNNSPFLPYTSASYAALSHWILICKGALTNDFSYRIVSSLLKRCHSFFSSPNCHFELNRINLDRCRHCTIEARLLHFTAFWHLSFQTQ